MYEAASFQVNGLHGVLLLLAVILFGIAAVVAFFVEGRLKWATMVSAGLCLATLAMLVSG